MNSRICIDITAHVAHVSLARPGKLNSLDSATFGELVEAGEELRQRSDVRAIVLSGQGASFCAGLDASFFRTITQTGGLGPKGPTLDKPLRERTHGSSNRAQRAATVWTDCRVPVIAAIQGHCYGGGLQVALGADFRLVRPDARLSVMEVRWGLVPDMGLFVLARDLVRPDVLAELVYTGRQFSGEEAVRLGVASRTCDDPVSAALTLASEIARRSPHAVRAAKRLLGLTGTADNPGILLQESLEQERLIGSANQIEAIRSEIDKRDAIFIDDRGGCEQ